MSTMNYDQFAADYARNRRVNPDVLHTLLMNQPVSEKAAILEVGCGTGNYIIAVAGAVNGAAYGLEPSAGMLAHALARQSSVRFVEGWAEALGFATNSFDLIFTVDVIHHVGNRVAYFREAYRVLKPGSWICTVTDSEDIIHRRQPLSRYFPETVEPELRRYPRVAELECLMHEAGFADYREELVEFAYPLTDLQIYRERAFSALHLIADSAWQAGMSRMEADLARDGHIPAVSMYVLLWGRKSA